MSYCYGIQNSFSKILTVIREIELSIPFMYIKDVRSAVAQNVSDLIRWKDNLNDRVNVNKLIESIDLVAENSQIMTLSKRIKDAINRCGLLGEDEQQQLVNEFSELRKSFQCKETLYKESSSLAKKQEVSEVKDKFFELLSKDDMKKQTFMLLLTRALIEENEFREEIESRIGNDYEWSPRMAIVAVLLYAHEDNFSWMRKQMLKRCDRSNASFNSKFDSVTDEASLKELALKIRALSTEDVVQLKRAITIEAFSLNKEVALSEEMKDTKRKIILLAGYLFPPTGYSTFGLKAENLQRKERLLKFLLHAAQVYFPSLSKEELIDTFIANPRNAQMFLRNSLYFSKGCDLTSKIRGTRGDFREEINSRILKVITVANSLDGLNSDLRNELSDFFFEQFEHLKKMGLSAKDGRRICQLPKGVWAELKENFNGFLEFHDRCQGSLVEYLELRSL